MIDQIGTPEIIDLAIVGATLLLGLAGFWRGVVKESLIFGSLVLGYLLTLEWAARWGRWVGDQTSLTTPKGQFSVVVTGLAISAIVLGYVACTSAGLPPADLPGRIGGFVVGSVNALFAFSILGTRARQLILTNEQNATLADTRVAWRLANEFELVLLLSCTIGFALVLVAANVRKRRAAIVSTVGVQRQGESGFQFRRREPLAPETEKIDPDAFDEAAAAGQNWTDRSAFSETVHLRRVPDPSMSGDRPNGHSAPSPVFANDPGPNTDEVVRCISCGERISDSDRFCPRCGRLLVS